MLEGCQPSNSESTGANLFQYRQGGMCRRHTDKPTHLLGAVKRICTCEERVLVAEGINCIRSLYTNYTQHIMMPFKDLLYFMEIDKISCYKNYYLKDTTSFILYLYSMGFIYYLVRTFVSSNFIGTILEEISLTFCFMHNFQLTR